MAEAEVTITNKRGLSARAATKLVQAVYRYDCDVWLKVEQRRVDAKNIMGVMLVARPGATIAVEAEGADADVALKAVVTLVQDKFGERE